MREWLQKRRLIPGILGLLIVAAVGTWGYLRSRDDPDPGVLEASGRVEGDQAAVGAKIAGRIINLPVREGQVLETSQVIAQLSSEQAKARLEQAEHDLHMARELLFTAEARRLEAQANRERAEEDYLRYRDLLADGAIAPQIVDQARATFNAAIGAEKATQGEIEAGRARIQLAEAGRMLAEANLADTRVLAPFPGTVLRRLVQEGEVVAAGTPLITLVDLAKLYAKVYVAQGEMGKIKIGDPARVYTDAFPKRYFEAAVSEVSERAEFTPRDIHMKDERATLVFAVKLALKNPEGFLKPGMPVDARIRWVPESAWGDGLE